MSRERDSSRRSASGAKADRILEQALKHELSAAGAQPADACLDAETLSAWVDGGLDAAAMTAAEIHVANCARCQALAGTVARSTPTLGTLGTSGTSGTTGTISLWRWWLAPLAAGVTAVTLWMVIPEQQQIAEAPPAEMAARDQAVDQRPQAADDQKPEPARESAPTASFATGADRQRAQPTDTLAAGARDDRQAPQPVAERKEAALTRQAKESAAAADAPAAPSPAAPPVGSVAAAQAPPPIATLQKGARLGFSPNAIEIPTLQPSVRWRIVGDSFIEITEDGGASWQRKHQIPGVHIGSAPSASVCWLAGGNGSVWLTTDGGATFKNVGIAEPLDIASVSARDDRNASVYTVVGRRFRTEDGGRTWRPF